MSSRLEGVPVLARRPDRVPAACYNLWRRARRRLGTPIRLALPSLAGMDLVLEAHAWICVDSRQADVPVVAWVDFDDRGRTAIHEPVPCHVHYYHFAATKYRARILQLMEQGLAERLRCSGTRPG